MPAVRQAAEPPGLVIGDSDRGVAEYLEPATIMAGDKRVQKVAYGMAPEIGRDIADAQPLFGVPVIRVVRLPRRAGR